MDTKLPHAWLPALLNDVSEIVTGKTPSTKNPHNFGGGVPFIKPADLDKGQYITQTVETLTDLGATSVPTVPANSIPVTCIGNLGKVGITKQISATNQQINTVVPSSLVDYRFFYYQLKTLKPWMQENASATTVTIINKAKFSKAPVLLPPFAEQKVIVDKLDTLLAQVETTQARLERIPQILKRFRQSVLAAAVSGKLMEDFQAFKSNSFTESYLPNRWQSFQLSELSDFITSGSRGWAKYYSDSGSLFIRSQDINTDELELNSPCFVTPPENKEGKRTKVQKNDLLLTITGANVTKCARVKVDLSDAYVSQHVGLIRLSDASMAPFIELILKAPNSGRYQLQKAAYGGGKPGLNLQNIKDVHWALPEPSEAEAIVRRVNELFAHADHIEQQVNNALARVNNLTQSILAKAFHGELTEQWRKDNPELISGENSAEALLERIKAERAAKAPVKRTRKKATA
ncbi:restriction endonuclease subunit S [Vreelandella andesensis]|uniref:Restriction endonuclease subunit S n=1 Tax=Vreelandella andesensis TaxID=447567 RepID=A0A433KKU7_9GAMM|nr:restriction endonuclease subunit S [Halomonas andesensis]RUR30173.1 restriction endonuclease subunit S [Halomonas andesensis]